MTYQFAYGTASVADFHAASSDSEAKTKRASTIEVHGEELVPTQRFFRSFFQRFRVSDSVFRYFDHDEVFQRVAAENSNDTVQYCVERSDSGTQRLLALTSPHRAVTYPDQLVDMVRRFDGANVRYADGIITSEHIPNTHTSVFKVGTDDFERRFVLETPVDGFGNPKIHEALLRLICTNGLVARHSTFRSEIRAGDDVAYSVERALLTFNNEEGFDALRQRVESAQTSWASIRELQDWTRILAREQNSGAIGINAHSRLQRFNDDTFNEYGLANSDTISPKKQRVLPAKCRVYDLLNLVSEAATHHGSPAARHTLYGHIGSMVSQEYDLEGTAGNCPEFRDFLLN